MMWIGKNKFLQNLGWMYGLKAVNYIFPLLLIPYLVRTIGIEKYGLLTATQALMGYFSILVNYGFELTATRNIAMHAGDLQEVRNEYNEVMTCKCCIAAIVFALFIMGLLLCPFANELKIFYGFGFCLVIGDLLFPSWFFQGMQAMKFITIINGYIKLIYLILVILFVHEESDYRYVLLCQGGAWILSGILSIYLIKRTYGFWFRPVFVMTVIERQLKAGFPIFIANACGNVYSKGALLFTGLIAGNVAAGYYALAEKICGTVVSLVQPYVSTLYPVLCQEYQQTKEAFYGFLDKFYRYMIIVDAVLFFSLYILAEVVSWIIQGKADDQLIMLIRGMSLVMMGTIINVLLHPFLLAAGKYKEIKKIYMIISGVFVVISIPLLYAFSYWGMVISMIIVEYSIGCYYICNLKDKE